MYFIKARIFHQSSTTIAQQARLAQSVARETLNLKVVGSSPTSGFSFAFVDLIDGDAGVVVEMVILETLIRALRHKPNLENT